MYQMLPNCSCRMPAFITVCKAVSDSHGLKLNYPTSKISLCTSTSILSCWQAPELATFLIIILIFSAPLPSPSLHIKKCIVLLNMVKDFRKEEKSSLQQSLLISTHLFRKTGCPSSVFLPYILHFSPQR